MDGGQGVAAIGHGLSVVVESLKGPLVAGEDQGAL